MMDDMKSKGEAAEEILGYASTTQEGMTIDRLLPVQGLKMGARTCPNSLDARQ